MSDLSKRSEERTKYECVKPPCVHVVVDWPKKIFAAFVEDAEGSILYVPAERITEACGKIREIMRKHVREAKDNEIDDLADRYLNAIVFTEGEE